LLGHARVVRVAIQADAQVRAALHADFPAARIAVQRPRLPALMTVAIHGLILPLPRAFVEQNPTGNDGWGGA
jgi:hypothetical protein